jgi:hypothetical protein
MELDWLLIGGHRRSMIEYVGTLPMQWFAATRFKFLLVKCKSRGIFLKFNQFASHTFVSCHTFCVKLVVVDCGYQPNIPIGRRLIRWP